MDDPLWHLLYQAVTTCWSLGAGLRGNGEIMRKLRGNGEKMRKLRGNGERVWKWSSRQSEREKEAPQVVPACTIVKSDKVDFRRFEHQAWK